MPEGVALAGLEAILENTGEKSGLEAAGAATQTKDVSWCKILRCLEIMAKSSRQIFREWTLEHGAEFELTHEEAAKVKEEVRLRTQQKQQKQSTDRSTV